MLKLTPVKIDNKIVGRIDWQTMTFYKIVSKSKHLFRKTDEWGIDAELFNRLILPNGFNIVIYEREEGKHYCLPAKEFKNYMTYREFKGYGKQVFVPRKAFKVN